MKLWMQDEDGVRRLFGMPVGIPFDTDPEVLLRGFEPENPKLWVPRTVGAGWNLNLGTVAVKLGLLRPDDSIPGLDTYFPQGIRHFFQWAPWAGAAAGASTALMLKDFPRVASNWSLSAHARRYMPGWASAALSTGVAVGTPVLLRLISRAGAQKAPQEAASELNGQEPTSAAGHNAAANSSSNREGGHQASGIDAVAAAQCVGLQALVTVANVAAYREAKNPGSSQPLLFGGLFAAPAITGGILVTAVRAALKEVERDLRAQ